MIRIDWKELIGGFVLLGVGIWFLVRALRLDVGTATAMGPGYYPMLASGAVIFLSIALLIPAFLRDGDGLRISWRPFIGVVASILTFAVVMSYFGLLPAVFLGILVGAAADTRSKPMPAALLALGVSAVVYLIFIYALGLPMRAFHWG